MINKNYIVSIAPKAREKLNSLTCEQRSKMLSTIRAILHQQEIVQQIRQLEKSKKKTLVRIPYSGDKRIIASLIIKPDTLQLRIIDFLSKDKIDKGHFSTDGTDYTIVYLEDPSSKTLFDTQIDKLTQPPAINRDSFWTTELVLITAADFEARDDDFWAYIIEEKSQQDPDLLLSSEQYEIAKTELPILLTGSPGSGKTTVAVFRAVYESYHKPEHKIVYLTSNSALKTLAQNQATRIYKQKLKNLSFFDYTSFCLDLGKKYQLINEYEFKPVKQITQQKFIDNFCLPRQITPLDSLYLWQEIRHLLKGSAQGNLSETGLITAAEYENLRSESVLPANSNYSEIYKLATAYQNWLKSQGYWDEIDLTRYLLGKITSEKYDILFCDDILSFTEIEVKLLLKLLKNNGVNYPTIFWTGTPEKVIKPIGLSWGKVKKIITEYYPKNQRIKLKELTNNFRTVSTILKLGEEVLTFANNNYPDKTTQITQRYSIVNSVEKPLIIFGSEGKILKGKNRLGDRHAIIVTNEEEKNKLAAIFNHQGIKQERILTITEIQGLEFDYVLGWKLLGDFEKLLAEKSPIKYEEERLKYELVYACTTIAKKKLFFYEKQFSEFWYRAEIDLLVNEGKTTVIENFFQEEEETEETKEILLETAATYENRGDWKFARENYLRAGEEEDAKIAEARLEESKGNWEKAGDIWDSLSVWDEAYRCWEQVSTELWQQKWENLNVKSWQKRGKYWEEEKNYQLSLYCYEKADDLSGQIRCLVANQKWELAGDKYSDRGEIEPAQEYYLKAEKLYLENNEVHLAAQMWTKLEQWEKAAPLWSQLEGWNLETEDIQEIGKIEQAAVYYEKAKLWLAAEKCWRKLNNWEKVAIACEKQKKWVDAASIWQKIEEKEKAAICYEKATEWNKAEECWRELKYWGCVAIACEQQNKWEAAAIAWKKTNPLTKAALCYERGEIWEKAEECWRELKNWERLALIAEHQENWLDAATNWEKIEIWERAALAWIKIYEVENAAECYEKGNLWFDAEECWRQLASWEKVAIACEHQSKWLDAAKIWEKSEIWQKAALAWQQINELEKAAICHEKALEWLAAETCWEKLGNLEGIATACERQSKWQKAAETWNKLNKLEKAAKCYEKAALWAGAEECWRKLSNWQNVALACARQNKWQKSAEAWKQIKKIDKAAICYEKASLWSNAEECWRELSNWEKVAIACENQGKWQQAGAAWKQILNIEKAAICYEKASLWSNAEECWRELSNWKKVAKICEYQNKWLDAAQIWEKLAEWKEAAQAWQQIKQTEKAAKCYEKGEFWFEAQECWRQLGNWEKVAITCERQNQYSGAAEAWKLAGNLEQAARFYQREKLWSEAEECWRELRNFEQVAIVCEHQNRYSAAGEAWKQTENLERAARCYEKGEFWAQAEECWRQLKNWDEVALCCERQNRWDTAATAWKTAGKLDQVAICYERDELWSQAEAYWRCLEDWERVAIACEHQNKWEDAAEAYLKMGGKKHYQAAKIYFKLGQWQKSILVGSQQRFFEL